MPASQKYLQAVTQPGYGFIRKPGQFVPVVSRQLKKLSAFMVMTTS
jgi:hypothetical protein